MFKNPTLLMLSFIMLINALAFGTVIPLLYPYAAKFGIDPLGLSLMFASFSIAQFISTPIIGRLADKYGRKPLLLICLFGTSVALAMFAMATSVTMLFVSRIIDGITGGNISVAQAMIADTTKGNERSKSFAMLGAAFGFGFLVGPALGGLMSQISLQAPFWFAAALGLIGTIAGIFVLPETLPKNVKVKRNEPLINIPALVRALFSPTIGVVILIGFLVATAQNAFIIGFQSFTTDVFKLSPTQVGLIFTLVGLVNIVMQAAGVRWILDTFKSKKAIIAVSCVSSAAALVAVYFTTTLPMFMGEMMFYIVAFAAVTPLITGLLSERTKAEDQGEVLGINQSFTSLGQIVGPLIAGVVAAEISIQATFLVAAGFLLIGVVASRWLYIPKVKPVDL